ncbi:MAG: hypothetical protein IJ284_01980 [Clostridia bacterium]|nr:hypothetical protein [Clostridia bacterium]
MENYSAIMEMFRGKRGCCENIEPSETYNERLHECVEIEDKIKERLKDNAETLELIEKLSWVTMGTEAAAVDDHYYEGFCFGVLLGLEVAGTRSK